MSSSKLKWDEVKSLARGARPWWRILYDKFWWQYGPVREHVERALAARAPTWKSANDIHSIVCVLANKECDWEQPHFELDDDLRIAFWSYYDGLDTESAFIELEDEYGISFPSEEIAEAMNGTVGELIHRIEAKLTAKSAAPSQFS